MSLAQTMRDRVAEQLGANLEYRRDGYRLAINPIQDRPSEVGFILWQETPEGLSPVVAGHTAGDELVLDGDAERTVAPRDLNAVVAALLAAPLDRVEGGYRDEAAIPTADNPGALSRNG